MTRLSLSVGAALAASLFASAGAARAADPTTADCLAASDASLKLGNQHRLRAERAQLLVCAATSCPNDIKKECTRRVDQVNTQIPTIIFAAKDATGADLSAVRVTMDGELLAERLEGTALSIDPGEHTFMFEAAGQETLTKKLVIQQSQKERREVIAFVSASPLTPTPTPTRSTSPVPADAPGAAVTSTTSSAPESTSGLPTGKVLAIAAGGVGVVGLGIGTAFGLMAASRKSDAESICASQCATQDGVNKWHDASTAGNISTTGFIVGVVALAGAAALWFTAPSGKHTTTQVGFGPGGIQVRGTW